MAMPGAQDLTGRTTGSNGDDFLAQAGSLLRALRRSRGRRSLAFLAAGLVGVICANALAQIRLNIWQGSFFDAIEQRSLATFGEQLLVFAVIVGVLLVLTVSQTWLHEMMKVRLRDWLSRDLLDEWLSPRRAHQLKFAGAIGVNPDQRLQEDVRHLTELSADLGVGLLQATLLLVSFVGVLWMLSVQVVFTYEGRSFFVPGYMVWCALAYALAGSWLTWRVGQPLIALNAERYGREAAFRFALVRASECAEGIALYGGEPGERLILGELLARVVAIMRALAMRLARLTWVTSGYGWVAIVVPILVAAPGYFGGTLSLGGLMMVVGAFYQVQQSLRWFVDNFSRIADWRATLLRVATFREALLRLDSPNVALGRLEVVEHPAGHFVLDHVAVFLTDGQAVLDEPLVQVRPGERVQIVGGAGTGKSMLFRAVAGLWPWGSGSIRMPPRKDVMFVPQGPYLPLGTLRSTVAYPADAGRFGDAELTAALEQVGLGRLVPALDQDIRWDRELSADEQQRLAFARLLLHAPRWAFLDEALDAVDDVQRGELLELLVRRVPDIAVVSMSRMPVPGSFFGRTCRLNRQASAPRAELYARRRPGRTGRLVAADRHPPA